MNSHPSQQIRAIILDYGEVLCHRPPETTFHQMAALAGVAPAEFEQRYFQDRLPYDQGALDAEEYWRAIAAPASLGDDALRELRRMDVEMWTRFDERMISWIPRLREAGYKTALLSNMPHDMAGHARQHFSWLNQLDFCLLSCEWNLIKPAAEIYHVCVNGLQVAAAEALFIDDRETNAAGARAAGLSAVRFESVEGLREDLRAFGISVLP